MKKVTDKKISMLNVLVWKAKELGVSYGELSTFVTLEEQMLYYQQYSLAMQQKEELENQRVEEIRKSKMTGAKKGKRPGE